MTIRVGLLLFLKNVLYFSYSFIMAAPSISKREFVSSDQNKVAVCLPLTCIILFQACASKTHTNVFVKTSDPLTFEFVGKSDSKWTQGVMNVLFRGLDGCTLDELDSVTPEVLKDLGFDIPMTSGRSGGLDGILRQIKRQAVKAAEIYLTAF